MSIVTEKINQNTVDIDLLNGAEIARLINEEDKKISSAVETEIPAIGAVIEKSAQRLAQGGRMAYFGSGTSGRIGILDASEMAPTFGVDENLVQGFISGGQKAIRFAVEGAEDSVDCARADLNAFMPTAKDVVIVLSASGNPLYGVEILKQARQRGALTVAICSNPEAKFKQYADIFICALVGAEAIVGSSRMKAGTAQKMIVNMISTGVMIKLGKVYHNYMVDLQISNQKLQQRAVRFVCEICGVDTNTAEKYLAQAKNVKTACVMIKKNCSLIEAQHLLEQNGGVLRRVIG